MCHAQSTTEGKIEREYLRNVRRKARDLRGYFDEDDGDDARLGNSRTTGVVFVAQITVRMSIRLMRSWQTSIVAGTVTVRPSKADLPLQTELHAVVIALKR